MEKERGPFLPNPFVARAARWGLVAWSLIGLLILIYLAWRFVLVPVGVIFPPLLVALVVIYLLNPVVSRLERRPIATRSLPARSPCFASLVDGASASWGRDVLEPCARRSISRVPYTFPALRAPFIRGEKPGSGARRETQSSKVMVHPSAPDVG